MVTQSSRWTSQAYYSGHVGFKSGRFERLVNYICVTEASLGEGVKPAYKSEPFSLKKLRRMLSQV